MAMMFRILFLSGLLVAAGRVSADAPAITDEAPQAGSTVAIEAAFGKAQIDVRRPSLKSLYLRGPDGRLGQESLLATDGRRRWATGAYTYLVDAQGERHESRVDRPRSVHVEGAGSRKLVRLIGISLTSVADGVSCRGEEDWTLSAPGDGRQLVWKIVRRRFGRPGNDEISGTPAMFFRFEAQHVPNSVTSTLWYDPLRIRAGSSLLYSPGPTSGAISANVLQTIRDRDTWAIYKLYTNWHAPADLRLEVEGGHLYRRGVFGLFTEAGAIADRSGSGKATVWQSGIGNLPADAKKDTEEVTLRIGPVEKRATGYQMAVRLPDRQAQEWLTDFYGSVLNGGTVCDQKGMDFGNESDGWYYGGSCWMNALALAAGVPAAGQLSAHPYSAAEAFRAKVEHILSVLDERGVPRYGYNQSGLWVDDILGVILGSRTYLVHTGDLSFVRANLPTFERMFAYFVQRCRSDGLFVLPPGGAHWYYDEVVTSGVNAFYNAFIYKAAGDLAEMADATGDRAGAERYRAMAARIKQAFNRVLWRENAPGGPRYLDWIAADGKEAAYFLDLCQWPAVAFGIASPEQGRKIVATADARMAKLAAEYGYPGVASVTTLWPIAERDMDTYGNERWKAFGVYQNGGLDPAMTYWEAMGRARAGDAEGAWRRLRLFGRHAHQTSWAGDNAASIKGELKNCAGEPYLADMVVAPAAVVHGILGIQPSWDRLEVHPCLPAGWPRAEADVLYRGRRHHVTVDHGRVEIRPLEQMYDWRPSWTMDFNLKQTPDGTAVTKNVEFAGHYSGTCGLKRLCDDGGAVAIWKFEETSGPAQDASPHQHHGAADDQGITRGQPGHRPGSRCYRFDGSAAVTIDEDEDFRFGPDESFTLQCWLCTKENGFLRMISKSGYPAFEVYGYGLYLSDGILEAWFADADRHRVIARGSHKINDGRWHHAAAVVDRREKQLRIYLDGRLDTPAGSPGKTNPADTSPVGPAQAMCSLTLGRDFGGLLDEVSIFRGALRPPQFNLKDDYPSPYGKPGIRYTASGSYQSPPHNWHAAVMVGQLTTAVDLHGGRATATVETSDDGFSSVRAADAVTLGDGVQTYRLTGLAAPAQFVRVRFDLAASAGAAATPVVDGFRVDQ